MARQEVLDGLIRRGIPAHIAQGIAGNIEVESGFNPGINEISPTVPGSRGGFGLFQHTGPRRRALESFAQQSGRPLADIDTQIDFALQELQTTERPAAQALFQTENAADAARVFSEKFLRPGIPHLDRRISAATGGNISGGAGSPSLLGSEGDDMANEQQRGGFLARQRQEGGLLGEGGILSPDRRDRLILGLEGMTLNPNQALQASAAQGIQQRAKGRETTAQRNQTGEFLRQRGREDLAAAVESGAITAAAAVKVALTPKKDTTPDAFRTLDLRAQAAGLQPGTPEYAEFFARGGKPAEADDPAPTNRIVTGDEAAALGLDPSKSYNITEGVAGTTASQIGGGPGTVVNVGAGETAFNKKTGEFLASEANDIAQQGASAQRNLGRIITLRRSLEGSPQGLAGSLTQIAGGLGIKTEGSTNIEVANAIISQLVPEQRPPGSGTMSDADLALFKASLPRLINTPEGNKRIIDTMEAIANYDVERGNIARRQQLGEIGPQQAFDAYAALGNPLAGFARADGAGTAQGTPADAASPAPVQGGATHRFNPETGKVEPIR